MLILASEARLLPLTNLTTAQFPMEPDSLEPQLAEAQKTLDRALEQTCGVDVKKANTGEMIRIEETLAIAAAAAKEVVSVRLRRRERSRRR